MSSFKKFFKNYKGSRFERFSWKLDDLIHELNEDYINILCKIYCKKDQDVIFLDFFDNVAKHEKEFLVN